MRRWFERLAGNAALLPQDVVAEIVERTDGVPLFVEEMTKAVLEAGIERGREIAASVPGASLGVPATLQASLMARLDRLGPAAKGVAQIGAAIGREFSYELTAAVGKLSDEKLQDALHRLVDAGLVFQRGAPPMAEYLFKHVGEFKINPQAFMAVVAKEISRALHDLMLEGIKYEKVAGAYWEQSRIEQDAEEGILRYLSNLYEVQNRNKSLFDAVEYDSEVEKQFARDLDSNENVKLFVKLPPWFSIDTPIGRYNPDWAFVTEREEKLYFVRETKSTLDSEERRTKENQKIACGRKHFDTLGVDYDVVTSLAEVKF